MTKFMTEWGRYRISLVVFYEKFNIFTKRALSVKFMRVLNKNFNDSYLKDLLRLWLQNKSLFKKCKPNSNLSRMIEVWISEMFKDWLCLLVVNQPKWLQLIFPSLFSAHWIENSNSLNSNFEYQSNDHVWTTKKFEYWLSRNPSEWSSYFLHCFLEI